MIWNVWDEFARLASLTMQPEVNIVIIVSKMLSTHFEAI